MTDFTWDAVPSQRQRKTEKYDYPVMTMAALAKPGAGRKFSFNKAAQELMGIEGEDRISFGFSTDRSVVAIRKADEGYGFKLTKTCTLSDKKTFEFISKTLELSNDVENEFKISDNSGFYTLELMKNAISNDEVEEALDKSETISKVRVTEEVADTIGNVNYPEVEEEMEVTPSEDVNNQW